jgi:hypothetical protein
MAHTYAELEISPAAYDEIEAKLRAVGYDQALVDGAIDMHGIGLVRAAATPLSEVHRLTQAFNEADAAWSKLLPKGIVNARYLPLGRGEPGSALRAAFEARQAAQQAYHRACDLWASRAT